MLKLLHVEDDEDIREVANMALELSGEFEVLQCASGEEAIERAVSALDADGNPTTDPDAALKGTMVPAGDAKGAALALMVEILTASLTGSSYAYEASSFFNADGPPPDIGQSFMLIDPDHFAGPAFANRLEVLLSKAARKGLALTSLVQRAAADGPVAPLCARHAEARRRSLNRQGHRGRRA